MLGILTPLKETRAYQDIWNESGEAHLVQFLEKLDKLHENGALSDSVYQVETEELRNKLEAIRAPRNKQVNS